MQGFESRCLKITALWKALKVFRFVTENVSCDFASGKRHSAEISISEAITVLPNHRLAIDDTCHSMQNVAADDLLPQTADFR